MESADPALLAAAREFADEVADLVHRTVSSDPPIRAVRWREQVVVAPYADDDSDSASPIPLTIAGAHRLDLRLRFSCIWDFTGQYLAIDTSEFALALPSKGRAEPLVRFDYVRDHSWAPGHIQVHAESSPLGYLLAFTRPNLEKVPGTQVLHLPVGGRRFRPSLEDVIEFAIRELGVKAKAGWQKRVDEGRRKWRQIQLLAALRDVIKHDPDQLPSQLKEAIDEAHRAVTGQREDADSGEG